MEHPNLSGAQLGMSPAPTLSPVPVGGRSNLTLQYRPGHAQAITDRDHTSSSPAARDHTSTSPVETSAVSVSKDESETCCICMCPPDRPKTLTCKHVFCTECIAEWFKTKPSCPSCGQLYGEMRGNQPDGRMSVTRQGARLPGHEVDSKGSIVIQYKFYGGTQEVRHMYPMYKVPVYKVHVKIMYMFYRMTCVYPCIHEYMYDISVFSPTGMPP